MSSLAQTRRAIQAAGVFRLERLKAAPRQPGEFFVDAEELLIMTTLCSCVAACAWDSRAGVGGLNHFMLPEGLGASGRYGSYAMERLINELLKRGAAHGSREAAGGGSVYLC